MNLHDMKIGLRLGLGFGSILLVAGALVVSAIVNSSSDRTTLLDTLQRTAAQQEIAHAMNTSLLKGAVAIRNMGLETKVEDVQKDQAEAKTQRAAYLDAKTKLEAMGLGVKEREVFAHLGEIDRRTDVHFNEAVDFSSQFAAEQAGAIITGKIDPLLNQSMTELENFIAMQKQNANVANVAAAQMDKNNATTVIVMSGVGLLVLTFSVIMAWRLTVSITHPLQHAVDATACVAHGDLVSEIEGAARHGQEETGILLAGLEQMRDGLAQIVGEVRTSADSISLAANEIADGNADLSRRTEAQSSSLEETAASMEELHAAVKNNADTAQQVNQMANAANTAAVHGGSVMREVVVTMQEITSASCKISDIIQVIDGIAFQTNILALNAAVEAARAGEQGRGFAVVATEVRSLAGRSAQAAKEIKSLIDVSVAKIDAGAQLVDKAGKTTQDIVTQVQRVAGLISDISASAHEQTCGLAQMNQAITQLDYMTQQNAALVEQVAASADNLKQQAVHMVDVVSVFKLPDRQLQRYHMAP